MAQPLECRRAGEMVYGGVIAALQCLHGISLHPDFTCQSSFRLFEAGFVQQPEEGDADLMWVFG